MRAHELIDGYIDPAKITHRFRRELEAALERQGLPADPTLLSLMYGDLAADLDLEQKRLDLLSSRAEIEKMQATA